MLGTFALVLNNKSIQGLFGTLHNSPCVRGLLFLSPPYSRRRNAVNRQNHPQGQLIINKDLYALDRHRHTLNVWQFLEIGVKRPCALQRSPWVSILDFRSPGPALPGVLMLSKQNPGLNMAQQPSLTSSPEDLFRQISAGIQR